MPLRNALSSYLDYVPYIDTLDIYPSFYHAEHLWCYEGEGNSERHAHKRSFVERIDVVKNLENKFTRDII